MGRKNIFSEINILIVRKVCKGFNNNGIKYYFDWIISSASASHFNFENFGKNWPFLLRVENINISQFSDSNSAEVATTKFNNRGLNYF